MDFVVTDGGHPHFIRLCHMLDDYLNEIAGGEGNRSQYVPYNSLDDIRDVILAYENDEPAGCVSFKHYDGETAEVKRVFVRKEHRGSGISKGLMLNLEGMALEKGFKKLILETGEPLVEAMGLYRLIGYMVIENYGPYRCMPGSVCMGKEIG